MSPEEIEAMEKAKAKKEKRTDGVACGEVAEKMEMEGKLKTKVEELKALSAKVVEMELRIRFLKTEIESKA